MRNVVSIFQILSIVIGSCILVLFLIPILLGIKPFIVLSGSMEPTIKVGSIAYINTHEKVQNIKDGDIIAFSFGDSQVTHRVLKINENQTFTTKGDANSVEDFAPVNFENYKGKTIFWIPNIGKVLLKTNTKTGKIIIALIVGFNIFFIIFDDIFEKNDIKEKDKKKDN